MVNSISIIIQFDGNSKEGCLILVQSLSGNFLLVVQGNIAI